MAESKKKKRRDPVADLLGDESPVLSTLATAAAEPVKADLPKPVSVPPRVETPPAQPTPRRPRQNNKPTPKPAIKPGAGGLSKRCPVSTEEDAMITELISKINQRVGAKVQYAQVTRSLWSLLQEAEDVFDRVHAPTLKRPSTGAEHEYAAFEADLAAYLLDLLQAVKPQPR